MALWQASEVASRVTAAGGPPCRIVVIKTSGDRLQDAPVSEIGGKRLFVKEIEDALLGGDIDLAVHSSKDLPAVLPDGLAIAGVLPREDPLDAVVLPLPNRSDVVSGFSRTDTAAEIDLARLTTLLGPSPSLGTGSVRRIAQLLRLFPGALFTPIRGNLDTRLRKLDNGEHDALILAAAGLRRLGLQSRISLRLPASVSVPAPGQGIIAIETRQDDEHVRQVVATINDAAADAALCAERALVAALGGGCQAPLGALASPVDHDNLELVAVVVSLDGGHALYGTARGTRGEAAAIGAKVGAQLITDGAEEILADARRRQATVDSPQSAVDHNDR
ncbi:MAG: hydroxymethylbilane synthase [Acidobacteria bacterium RIFCSPLOWO2_12_FULL_65_11]|nr:MAG: hydroxymethylbilane synthase [Acidobacteria bacterium RIFCSPLOWO2_02_FULL_64_15]OFW31489.1 MAG: hydroxymethylbilane synthase [Acidobacteria bacterium RIFCSPLOWO2_12_FULL_65_11]